MEQRALTDSKKEKIKKLTTKAIPSKVGLKVTASPHKPIQVEGFAEWERKQKRALNAWERRLEWQMLSPGIRAMERRSGSVSTY